MEAAHKPIIENSATRTPGECRACTPEIHELARFGSCQSFALHALAATTQHLNLVSCSSQWQISWIACNAEASRFCTAIKNSHVEPMKNPGVNQSSSESGLNFCPPAVVSHIFWDKSKERGSFIESSLEVFLHLSLRIEGKTLTPKGTMSTRSQAWIPLPRRVPAARPNAESPADFATGPPKCHTTWISCAPESHLLQKLI